VTVRWIPMLVVALLSLLPACAGGSTPAPAIDASPEVPAPSTSAAAGHSQRPLDDSRAEPAVPAAEPPVLTLVDAGQTPRQRLRYDFPRTRVDVPISGLLTTTYGLNGTTVSGDPLPDRGPMTMATPTEVTVTDVDDVGAATVAVVFGGGEVVDPGGLERTELEGVEDAVASLAGVRITYQVDDRGLATSLDSAVPDDVRPERAMDLTGIAKRVPAFVQLLPDEPVGVGAVWRVTSTTTVGGVPVVHTVRVELLDIDGELLELLSTVEDAGPAEPARRALPVDPTGSAPGTAAVEDTVLTSLTLDGGGNVTARLDRPVPVAASKGMTAELLVDVLTGHGAATLERTIVSDASLETDG
jgi:hypothetical protein